MPVLKYKYEQLADTLVNKIQIGEYRRGYKLPSERNMCRHYGVSRECVRKMFNHLESKGHVFRIGGKGAFVGNKFDLPPKERPSSMIIAFTNLNFPDFVPANAATMAMSNVLREHSYHLISEWIPDDPKIEREVIISLLDRGVDGLILTATAKTLNDDIIDNRKFYMSLVERNVPFVVFDRFVTGRGWSVVSYEVKESTALILQKLKDFGKRKIAYLGLNATIAGRERFEAYSEAMLNLGLKVNSDLVFLGQEAHEFDPLNFGKQAMLKLIKSKVEFDSIMAFSDLIVYGAYRTLIESKMKLEGKCFGAFRSEDKLIDEDFFEKLVTNKSRPFFSMGRYAAQLLLNEISSYGKAEKIQARISMEFDDSLDMVDGLKNTPI